MADIDTFILDAIRTSADGEVTVKDVHARLSTNYGLDATEKRVRIHLNKLVRIGDLESRMVDGLPEGRKRFYKLVVN